MSRNTTLAAGAAVLLAVAAAIVMARKDPETSEQTAKDHRQVDSKRGAEGSSDGAPGKSPSGTRQRDAVKNPELAAKYGEARTNLSKHVTSNVISLMQDAIEIGEMVGSGQAGGPFGGEGRVRMGLGRVYNELQLNEDQKTRVAEIHSEFQKRELQRSKDAVARLEKDPVPLMRMMLASDALARGEMTEQEYKELQTASGKDLEGVVNPLDERSFRGGRPLNDEAFVRDLKAVLEPEQAAKLDESIAQSEQDAPAESPERGNFSALPAMELEKLDSTIESVKKLTTGFKSVMEGFGGLQDLGPLIQPQRQGAGETQGAGGDAGASE